MNLKFIRLEILLAGILFCGAALFAVQLGIDDNSSWGFYRVSLLASGVFLLILGIRFPKIIVGHERIAAFGVYINQTLAWCFLVFICLEILVRITIYNPSLYVVNINFLGEVPAENGMVLYAKEGFAWTRYEKYREVSTPLHGTDHILILGDSYAEALQVPIENKYASVAERMLHEKNKAIDIHNFGRGGSAMADYVSFVPILKSIYPFKVIVVQINNIDFIESFQPEKINYFIKKDGGIDLVHRKDLSAGVITTSDKRINLYSVAMDLAYTRLKLIQEIKNTSSASTKEFNLELAQQQLDKLVKACDGVPLVLVLLPDTPKISGDQIINSGPEYETLKKLLSNNPGITVVDPLPEFQKLGKKGYFPRGFFNSTIPGNGHLNVKGNEIVGRLLAEAIEKVLP